MRNIGQSLALLALSTVSYAALGQASLSIQNGKPEKPVVGLPFSAVQSVRLAERLGNVMTLTREIKGRIDRSADGVERLEGTAVPIDFALPNRTTQVWIVDRAKHTAVLLDSKLKTATVTHLPADATVTVSFLPPPRASGPASAAPVKPENVATTDLGKRTQDGMDLVGKRVTETIPAGKVGNVQPILVTTDVWTAPRLKIVVNEVERNPLFGVRNFELSNIRSEEPDPRLFEIPEGYTLKEQPSLIPGASAQ